MSLSDQEYEAEIIRWIISSLDYVEDFNLRPGDENRPEIKRMIEENSHRAMPAIYPLKDMPDRERFIKAVKAWIDTGGLPKCEFNNDYSKMRIFKVQKFFTRI